MEKEVIKVDGHTCTWSDVRCTVSVVHGKHHFACAPIDGDCPVEPACHYDNPLGFSNYQTMGPCIIRESSFYCSPSRDDANKRAAMGLVADQNLTQPVAFEIRTNHPGVRGVTVNMDAPTLIT